MTKITKYLKNFGKAITGLTFAKLPYDTITKEQADKICNSILDNCSASLKTLKFEGIQMNKSMIPKMRTLFASLESIHLHKCSFDVIDDSFLAECNQLVKLDIVSCGKCGTLALQNSYPNLKSLALDGTALADVNLIEQFLQKHNHLQELDFSIKTVIDNVQQHRIFDVITECCSKSLTSLHLDGFVIDDKLVPQTKILFGNLTSLTLKNCRLTASSEEGCFVDCKKVVKLSIDNVKDFFRMATVNDFPQLEYVRMNGSKDLQAEEFLKNQNKLKDIQIHDIEYPWDILRTVDDLKQWKKLFVGRKTHNPFDTLSATKYLPAIKNIKKLLYFCPEEIDFVFDEYGDDRVEYYPVFRPVLKQMDGSINTLTHLEVNNISDGASAVEALARFKNLIHVHLAVLKRKDGGNSDVDSDMGSGDDYNSDGNSCDSKPSSVKGITMDKALINLVTSLKKLKHLAINCKKFVLEYETHKEMLDILRKRKQQLTLLINKTSFAKVEEAKPGYEYFIIKRDATAPC